MTEVSTLSNRWEKSLKEWPKKTSILGIGGMIGAMEKNHKDWMKARFYCSPENQKIIGSMLFQKSWQQHP